MVRPASALPNDGLPIPDEALARFDALTEGLDAAALGWLSGYAAGLARGRGIVAAPEARPAALAATPPLTVLYGSQTGNARRIAEALVSRLQTSGVAVRLVRADAYPRRELAQERQLVIVISTQGDGDPPEDARGFVEFLLGRRAPKLPQLRYAVLGLGDSSYPKFCWIGRQLDERLADLGASRWLPRADADVDIERVAQPWTESLEQLARESTPARPPLATVTPLRSAAPATGTRERPLEAEVLANQRITSRSSDRDIRHLELAVPGLAYEPGDALGIWPRNPPDTVAALLAALRLPGEAEVSVGGERTTLAEALLSRVEITRLSRSFVVAHAERAGDSALTALLSEAQRAALAARLSQWQLIDLVLAHPAAWHAEDLIAALRPLQPRLYSIASSRLAVGDEAHLCVAHAAWQRDGQPRWGAASHHLAGLAEETKLPVFLEHNPRFRLPSDSARDLVMIGPGTGVAPFRGFLQQRIAEGARGRHWLFFGNPHSRSDFLYQLEWQQAHRAGHLQRIDLAFSRDQDHKVYVQHRLLERADELLSWLDDGAHLYVCGDASRMAKDVHAALIEVCARRHGGDAERASEALAGLQTEGRYQRDVY
jgi:sulfite reductase (NADPH) flavoprotein alpha-component